MRTEKDSKKVMVLGTEYDFKVMDRNKDDILVSNNWIARHHKEDKEIILGTSTGYTSTGEDENIRHELIHAYFAQCGLTKYQNDEVLVEMLSMLIPRMNKTFKELDCLE